MPFSSSSPVRSALLAVVLSACVSIAFGATPKEQKAIVQTGTGPADAVLKLQTVPVLEPGANQVLIKVYAAGVNPVDWKSRAGGPGYEPAPGAPASAILGGDAAGVVEKVGSGVTEFKVGDAVFGLIGRNPKVMNGGYSEYVVASVANLAHKPRNVTYTEAAGLGIATVTGVRAVNVTKVAKGQRVLITGVSGGVGSAAAQAAKARGAYVIGTASARHNAYLKSIGVDEVIDYTKVKFENQVKNVDVVIDTVGADTADRALTTVKKTGLYVSVAARDMEAKCAAAGVTCESRGVALEIGKPVYDEIVSLASTGKLKVNIDETFPLAQAAQAHVFGEEGHTEGKIVLIVNAAEAGKK